MSEQKIAYEQHPISPERKQELINKGYKILDEKFDPEPKTEKNKKPAAKKAPAKKRTVKKAEQ